MGVGTVQGLCEREGVSEKGGWLGDRGGGGGAGTREVVELPILKQD